LKTPHFMEEILDQTFNENEKDETRINRITCIARLVLFIFISWDSYAFYTSQKSTSDGSSVMWNTTIFFIIFVLAFVYYNFIFARAEWTRKYVVGLTSIWATGFAMLLYIGIIYGSIVGVFRLIKYDIIGLRMIYFILLILVLVLISWREMTYLIRDRRLKRLNNE